MGAESESLRRELVTYTDPYGVERTTSVNSKSRQQRGFRVYVVRIVSTPREMFLATGLNPLE
jgi:hypothetical protein